MARRRLGALSMELRQLRYLVKVCEFRSMGRAAIELLTLRHAGETVRAAQQAHLSGHVRLTLSKKKPGSVNFSSTGADSASHLAAELFNQRAGIDTVHVPPRAGAPALQDLLGQGIASYLSAPPTALPHVAAGNVIPLATTGLTRPAV